jgi:hypothetical protein
MGQKRQRHPAPQPISGLPFRCGTGRENSRGGAGTYGEENVKHFFMTIALIQPSLRPHPLRAGLPLTAEASAASDLKLFLCTWLGGFVFFGTLLA